MQLIQKMKCHKYSENEKQLTGGAQATQMPHKRKESVNKKKTNNQ